MACCGKNESDGETSAGDECIKLKENENPTFLWHPTLKNAKQIAYVRNLECRYEKLHLAYFDLSAQLARLQSCLTQIVQADACERVKLIDELKRKGFKNTNCYVCPTLEQQNAEMGSLRKKQQLVLTNLRQKICSFQQAAANLDKKELLEKDSDNSLMCGGCFTSCRSSQAKETASVKVTNYEEKPQTGKAKKVKKQKSRSTSAGKISDPPKIEDTNKLKGKAVKKNQDNTLENIEKKTASALSNKKSNQDLSSKKVALSCTTLTSGQSIISTRSASFKELRAKYQQNQVPNK